MLSHIGPLLERDYDYRKHHSKLIQHIGCFFSILNKILKTKRHPMNVYEYENGIYKTVNKLNRKKFSIFNIQNFLLPLWSSCKNI